jgi:hypothetical protein
VAHYEKIHVVPFRIFLSHPHTIVKAEAGYGYPSAWLAGVYLSQSDHKIEPIAT